MLTIMRQRVRAYMSQRVYSLLGIFFLLLSLTLTTHAMLTVSNSGLSGDANVAVDGSGTLNIGTASSTGITIGRSGQAVNFPGNLSITGNATTTGNLTVLGELFDAGGNSYATSTSGSNPWTTVSGGISYSSGNVTVGTTVLDPVYGISGPTHINAQSGFTYTLQSSDCGKTITSSSGAVTTLTVPPGLPIGCAATIYQLASNTGIVSPLAGAGVTFLTTAATTGIGTSFYLLSISTNTYIMVESANIPTMGLGVLKGLDGNAVPAGYADVAALWPCTGYLKSDGTCAAGLTPQNLLTSSEDVTLTYGTWTPGAGITGTSAHLATVSGAGNFLYQAVTVTPGQAYVFGFDALLGSATGFKYAVYDVTHSAWIVAATDYTTLVQANAYTRVTVSFTAPAGCTAARVYLNTDISGTGTIYWTRMQLSAGTCEAPYVKTGGAIVP